MVGASDSPVAHLAHDLLFHSWVGSIRGRVLMLLISSLDVIRARITTKRRCLGIMCLVPIVGVDSPLSPYWAVTQVVGFFIIVLSLHLNNHIVSSRLNLVALVVLFRAHVYALWIIVIII